MAPDRQHGTIAEAAGGVHHDPLKLALRVAAASDTLARLHRGAVASHARATFTSDSMSSEARELQILCLARRLAVAAETLAQSQEGPAVKKLRQASHEKISKSSPAVVKVTTLVAKEARKVAERQARCSAVPQAWEIEVLDPEWVQQTLKEQASCIEEDQVCPASSKYLLPLTCPLSGALLQVPVRGCNCKHIACFDLESFRHSAPAGWKCPMIGCDALVYPEALRRDSFLEALLSLTNASMTTLPLGTELMSIKTRGSAIERAKALAEEAMAMHFRTASLRRKISSPLKRSSVAALAPIEIDDSDVESPQKAGPHVELVH